MNKEELIDWFWNKYNSCYPVTHPDYPQSIFLYYDKQFARKLKLCKLTGASIKLPSKVPGVCLFEQEWKYKDFYYNYDEIYQFLYKNYNTNYKKINDFVKDMLNDASKLQVLTPLKQNCHNYLKLNDASKLQVLTPIILTLTKEKLLNDASKLQVLTPGSPAYTLLSKLNDTSKLQVLI